MKLITFFYHQIYRSDKPEYLGLFENHLQNLKKNHSIVLPHQALQAGLNICLSFDDAYYDFYHYIFPLLKKYQIPAVLGIPTAFIKDTTEDSSEQRLSVAYPAGLDSGNDREALCTWPEIKEMLDSGLVYPAAHGHRHEALDTRDVARIETDVRSAQHLIQEKCGVKPDCFIYPFGKMSSIAHIIVRRYYKLAFRIGNAINYTWTQNNGLLYRIDAEAFWLKQRPFNSSFFWQMHWNHLWNRIRRK